MADTNRDIEIEFTNSHDDENGYWNQKLEGSFETGGFNPDKHMTKLGKFESSELSFEICEDDKLGIERDYGRNPIFNTMFNMLKKPEIKIHGLDFINIQLRLIIYNSTLSWMVKREISE